MTEQSDGKPEDRQISQWEFLGEPPTREEAVALLGTLRPVWGVPTVTYADYVQALPQRKRVKRPHPENPSIMVDDFLDAWVLYMGVAGRQMMLSEAAENRQWRVDFEPEPHTPTNVPGFLEFEDRIVYREYLTVHEWDDHEKTWRMLGRKPGTAWVPRTGGRQAAGSNPYEKVETAARGRAIAAWGFGVLPGSGVASIEEIQNASMANAAMQAEGAGRGNGGGERRNRPSREEMVTDALTLAEKVRQARGLSEEEMTGRMAQFLGERLGIREVFTGERIDWTKVKDGQVLLLANSLHDSLRKIQNEEADL